MITLAKLAVYREFGGNDDGWSRAGCPKQEIFEDKDWSTIGNLLQELTMLKRNLVSKEYGEDISKRLAEVAADKATAKALLDLA
jgi:hypothetical protein